MNYSPNYQIRKVESEAAPNNAEPLASDNQIAIGENKACKDKLSQKKCLKLKKKKKGKGCKKKGTQKKCKKTCDLCPDGKFFDQISIIYLLSFFNIFLHFVFQYNFKNFEN